MTLRENKYLHTSTRDWQMCNKFYFQSSALRHLHIKIKMRIKHTHKTHTQKQHKTTPRHMRMSYRYRRDSAYVNGAKARTVVVLVLLSSKFSVHVPYFESNVVLHRSPTNARGLSEFLYSPQIRYRYATTFAVEFAWI